MTTPEKTSKSNDDGNERQPVDLPFYFPEQEVTIEAPSYEEALTKMKKKTNKEGSN